LQDTILTEKLGIVVLDFHHSYGGKHNQEDVVQASLRKTQHPISNMSTAKRAAGVAQVGECPEFKNPVLLKKKKKSSWVLVARACDPDYLGG
jgi:hypothetical protein